MNRITLIGNLGSNPTIKEGEKSPAAFFSLATNIVYFDQAGTRRKHTDWHDIVAFNGKARSAAALAKGDLVAVSGRVKTKLVKHEGRTFRVAQVLAEEILFLHLKDRADAGEGDELLEEAGEQESAEIDD